MPNPKLYMHESIEAHSISHVLFFLLEYLSFPYLVYCLSLHTLLDASSLKLFFMITYTHLHLSLSSSRLEVCTSPSNVAGRMQVHVRAEYSGDYATLYTL
eukprot:c37957_g1_i1 orf=3-302(-)